MPADSHPRQSGTIIMRCPDCGLTVHTPTPAELPDEGPICAMGHPETPMLLVTMSGRTQG